MNMKISSVIILFACAFLVVGCTSKSDTSKSSGNEYVLSIIKSIQSNNHDNLINAVIDTEELNKRLLKSCEHVSEFERNKCIEKEKEMMLRTFRPFRRPDGTIEEGLYKSFPVSAKYDLDYKAKDKVVNDIAGTYYIKVTYANPKESTQFKHPWGYAGPMIKEVVYHLHVNKTGKYPYYVLSEVASFLGMGDPLSFFEDSNNKESANSDRSRDGSPSSVKASFDCAKASTNAEQMICSNQELAQADIQLAQVYKAALSKTSDKVALKKEQGAWIRNQRDVCPDTATMLQVYQDRISQLSR